MAPAQGVLVRLSCQARPVVVVALELHLVWSLVSGSLGPLASAPGSLATALDLRHSRTRPEWSLRLP